MKQFICFLIVVWTIGSYTAYSQCPNYSGDVNTLPVCGTYGDANGNSNWDWENTDLGPGSTYCSMWYARTSTSSNLTAMGSPFVNPGPSALYSIAQEHDYTKAKGWELLRRDFGCSKITAFPYFVLYNKYSGIIRVFVYVPEGQSTVKGITVEVTPISGTSAWPATTSSGDELLTAPDKFPDSHDAGKSIIAVGEQGGLSGWALAEINPSFDPDIQNNNYKNAALTFTVYGVTNFAMKAKIKGGSVTSNTPVYNFNFVPTISNSNPNPQLIDFKGTGEKYIQFSHGLTNLRNQANEKATFVFNSLSNVLDSNSLLGRIKSWAKTAKDMTQTTDEFGKAIGQISKGLSEFGSVLKFIGGVIGFLSGNAGTPAAMPSYTSYDLVLDGTITATAIQTVFTIKTPGTIQTDNSNATYYTCPLGIFNIKNTPEADVVVYKRLHKYLESPVFPIAKIEYLDYVSYRMRNNIQVSYNDGAGLDLVSVQAAIIGEILPLQDGSASYDPFEEQRQFELGPNQKDFIYNHMRPDLENNRLEFTRYDPDKGLHIFQTPYVNLECLNGLAFNAPATTKVYLQVKAILKKKNDPLNAPIYYIQNYKIGTFAATITEDMQNKYKSWNHAIEYLPPYTNYTELPLYQSDIVRSNNNYTVSATEKADNSITVQDNVTINPSALVVFTAGGIVDLKPGFEAKAGCEFTASINKFGYNITCQSPQVSPYTFPGNCYNTSITALRARPSETTTPTEESTQRLSIYPTLSNGAVTITGSKLQRSQITIVDQSGRVVYQYSNGSDKNFIQLNLQHLSNGMYFIRVQGQGETVTKKLLISK